MTAPGMLSSTTAPPGDACDQRPRPVLRARTLELLWHCHERNEEAERYGLVQAAQTPEGVLSIDYTATEGGRLVTTGGDMCIRLWRVDEHAIGSWLEDAVSDMSACCRFLATMRTSWMPLTARWSPHGQLIASAHCEGKICLWWRDQNSAVNHRGAGDTSEPGAPLTEDLVEEEWKDYRHLSGHISDVHDMCFSPDSRYLLSGAGDGSIVIHDLDGSSMPIIQLTDLHSKFCRGVAWDPWGRYIHSFGCGPALQCFTVVPRREKAASAASAAADDEEGTSPGSAASAHHHSHRGSGGRRVRQLQLVNQRRCQGDFIGESCALSFRRLAWSPDGTWLAVPFGKVPRATSSGKDGAQSSAPRRSTEDLFAAIDAREQASLPPPSTTAATTAASSPPNTTGEEESTLFERVDAADGNQGASTAAAAGRADDMLHCVQLYVRGAMESPAARLTVRGYSEIRGVQWAPCFLTPVTATPYVSGAAGGETGAPCAHAVNEELALGADMVGVDVLPAAPETAAHEGGASSQPGSAAAPTTEPATGPVHTSANGKASLIVAPSASNSEAWSLTDYRMALAVWTSDSVIVYTTDQLVRHSDVTDLHMRSITDVAWNASASYLFTSALDGYVSVIAMGDSLTLAYRLPTFSTRPLTQRLVSVLQHIMDDGAAVERGRVVRREASRLAAEASARASREAGGDGAGHATPTVAVVRKKKKVEATPVAATDVQIDQLEALMSGL